MGVAQVCGVVEGEDESWPDSDLIIAKRGTEKPRQMLFRTALNLCAL